MERCSKLADLKLVSKYYPAAPIANYSYPQPDRQSQDGRRVGRGSDDRSSLGSEGSAPGLIDDRTDSEVSMEDDYQYHTHATEIWDSFWHPSPEPQEKEKDRAFDLHPRKQYPALIPSPEHQAKQGGEKRQGAAWPLPEHPRPRNRKPAATYSPFPKVAPMPPRTTSLVPSWQPSRPTSKPKRPPRPDEDLLPPCIRKMSASMAHPETPSETDKTTFFLPVTAPNLQPAVKHRSMEHRPTEHCQTASVQARPVTATGHREPTRIAAVRTTTDLPLDDSKPLPPIILPKKSLPCLRPVQIEPEPRSVFEVDDDDEDEDSGLASDSHGLNFFHFHKRGESSDARRVAKSSEPLARWRRARASTAPSSPTRDRQKRISRQEVPGRTRQGGDVWGRMLGRRAK